YTKREEYVRVLIALFNTFANFSFRDFRLEGIPYIAQWKYPYTIYCMSQEKECKFHSLCTVVPPATQLLGVKNPLFGGQ
ncbi:MAG: hypothetical protein VX911_12500, partial [Candidatus Latescibacterota bacterium]|nr:hypothetical protein [Candidatus Latescibacterota bacterium]